MNVPTLYEHEDRVGNDLSQPAKWILTFCAWLILILIWTIMMEAHMGY